MPNAESLTGPSRRGSYARFESRGKGLGMLDVVLVLTTVAFFALSFLMIRWFDRI
jgi:hypothetical protein